MNFLAHAFPVLGHPWLVAGTALPDWARGAGDRLVGDRVDARETSAPALALGVERHVADDHRFHGSAAFRDLERLATLWIRALEPGNPRLRARFLGHVAVEILLDAAIERRCPGVLDLYYADLAIVPASDVAAIAGPWCRSGGDRLAETIDRFRAARFLERYASDAGVAKGLGRIAERLSLPPLPAGLERIVAELRPRVVERAVELLPELSD